MGGLLYTYSTLSLSLSLPDYAALLCNTLTQQQKGNEKYITKAWQQAIRGPVLSVTRNSLNATPTVHFLSVSSKLLIFKHLATLNFAQRRNLHKVH